MKKVIPPDSNLIPDSATRVFQGKIFDVYQWPQQMFDGSEATFEMLKRPDTVLAICVVNDDKVLVIDDEQPHTGARKSFPGGRVDLTDVSIETAAQREVLEETGYSFKNWRLIKVWQPHLKIEWFVYLLVAWEVADKTDYNHDAGEKIVVHELSLSELKQLVFDKAGYLGEGADVTVALTSISELLALPPYEGQTVDR